MVTKSNQSHELLNKNQSLQDSKFKGSKPELKDDQTPKFSTHSCNYSSNESQIISKKQKSSYITQNEDLNQSAEQDGTNSKTDLSKKSFGVEITHNKDAFSNTGWNRSNISIKTRDVNKKISDYSEILSTYNNSLRNINSGETTIIHHENTFQNSDNDFSIINDNANNNLQDLKEIKGHKFIKETKSLHKISKGLEIGQNEDVFQYDEKDQVNYNVDRNESTEECINKVIKETKSLSKLSKGFEIVQNEDVFRSYEEDNSDSLENMNQVIEENKSLSQKSKGFEMVENEDVFQTYESDDSGSLENMNQVYKPVVIMNSLQIKNDLEQIREISHQTSEKTDTQRTDQVVSQNEISNIDSENEEFGKEKVELIESIKKASINPRENAKYKLSDHSNSPKQDFEDDFEEVKDTQYISGGKIDQDNSEYNTTEKVVVSNFKDINQSESISYSAEDLTDYNMQTENSGELPKDLVIHKNNYQNSDFTSKNQNYPETKFDEQNQKNTTIDHFGKLNIPSEIFNQIDINTKVQDLRVSPCEKKDSSENSRNDENPHSQKYFLNDEFVLPNTNFENGNEKLNSDRKISCDNGSYHNKSLNTHESEEIKENDIPINLNYDSANDNYFSTFHPHNYLTDNLNRISEMSEHLEESKVDSRNS